MRVLHVVATAERRGAEVFASSLVEALAGFGVEQCVVVLRPDGEARVPFAAPVIAPRGSGRRVSGLRMEPGRVRAVREALRGFRPDAVQAHGGEPLKYVLAAERGYGGRSVYRRIGDAAQFGTSRLRERAHVALMRRPARVITVAEVLRSELVSRFGLPPSRVVTIPNGVTLRSLEPSRSRTETRDWLGITREARVVLSLGALTWEKDPVGHVRIVAAVADRPGVMHVIAGDGPLRTRVEAEIVAAGATDRTLMLGRRDDVPDLLAASDVLLLASRSEGMPACVIEAGMVGLPVAAYALSGVPEVVVDGETGRLASPGDVRALAAALRELLHDDEQRRRMGEAASDRCRERFDIEVVAPRYLDVYEQVARAA
jgi:glycosyltransferase involved in cell wall biosynthesis